MRTHFSCFFAHQHIVHVYMKTLNLQCINIVCINTVVEYLFNACIFGSTLNTLYVFIVCLKLSVVKGFVADLPITFETENT